MNFRPYQSTDYSNLLRAFEQHDKVLYQLSTGGGKTVVVSQFVNDMMEQEKKFLILVHKERLLRQMVKTLKSMGLWVGHIIRGEHVNLDAMCIVASVSTVMRDGRIDLIKDRHFDYIVIDEAHHAVANSFNKVVEAANHGSPCKVLGVTATPYRADNRNLKDIFDTLVISSAPMRQLITDGYLSNYKVASTPVKQIKEMVGRSGSDYRISDLSKYMRQHAMIDYLVQSYETHAADRQSICFCVDVEHAKQVMEAFQLAGHDKVAYIDAGTKPKDREKILEDFQAGLIKIIFCIETLTEGVDLPECNAVQLARPTLSLILYLQMVGRGLRPKEDGGDCIILDNAGLTSEFGVPDAYRNWQLDSDLNPIVPGDKILVGRKKDGSITDDIDDEEMSDLFEMDYDDFINQSLMSEEEAEEKNRNIKATKLKSLEELAEFFIIMSNVPMHKVKDDWNEENSIYFRMNNIDFFSFRISLVENSTEKFFKLEFGYQNEIKDQINRMIYYGQLCQFVKKNYLKINNLFYSLKKESDKKIDISKLRESIKERKLKYVEQLLTTELEKGKIEFEFKNEYKDLEFASNLLTKLDGKVRKIIFLNSKLNKSCKVEIHADKNYGWSETNIKPLPPEQKFIPTEKIINLFENYFD